MHETQQLPASLRRRSLVLAGGAALAAGGLPLAAQAQAQAEDIVIGGSIPMTGVFAFAGIGINAGIADYVKIANDAGGIKGRKLRYVPEDTGYKVDVSVAAFKKITSQNKVNLYYGDSTGFSKTINPELDRNGNILMAGASFATELNDPKKYPNQFLVGPDYTEMFGILLKHIAKEKPGAKVAFVYSDSEFGRDPIEKSEAEAKKLGRPWEIAKAFEHSAPVSPIVPASRIGHPAAGRVWLEVNGVKKQDGDLNQMIWKVPEIIAELSKLFVLAPGDVIMTGTPAGVAAITRGDSISCGVDGISTLSLKVV